MSNLANLRKLTDEDKYRLYRSYFKVSLVLNLQYLVQNNSLRLDEIKEIKEDLEIIRFGTRQKYILCDYYDIFTRCSRCDYAESLDDEEQCSYRRSLKWEKLKEQKFLLELVNKKLEKGVCV